MSTFSPGSFDLAGETFAKESRLGRFLPSTPSSIHAYRRKRSGFSHHRSNGSTYSVTRPNRLRQNQPSLAGAWGSTRRDSASLVSTAAAISAFPPRISRK